MQILLIILLMQLVLQVNSQLLKLQNGFINGTFSKTKTGRIFRQFHGIPYAEPPIGKLRFQAPVPAKPWSGVKTTTELPPMCIQFHILASDIPPSGQEDCLYINVFAPSDSSSESAKLPVIVFIHGGGYHFGDGASNRPDYFMDRDVVFATINYRLGVFGFLSMNDDHISGNFGMKDQVLALQWIRENIAVFGGDPDNVTLTGESAGAAMVHLHLFSPLSKGLFHKVIMQSGSAFAAWSVDEDEHAVAVAIAFVISTGCFYKDTSKTLKCLQRMPADELAAVALSFNDFRASTIAPFFFKPCIESKVKHQPFLNQRPTKHSYQTNVPWITGINSAEGILMVEKFLKNNESLLNLVNTNRKTYFPKIMDYLLFVDPDNWDDLTQKISNFYFDNQEVTVSKLIQMHTDFMFAYPMMKAIRSTHVPRYVYFYDHRGSFSWQQMMPNVKTDLGVSHADELPLLFRDEGLEAKWTPQDELVSQTLLNNWINFAIYADPNGISKEKQWKPVETDGIEYLHIKSDSVAMEKDLLKVNSEFLDSLPLVRNIA